MIIVTGATGQLGRAIVAQLARRTDPAGIGVSVRDPAKAQDLARRGMRVRRGDFADPASLREAFEGASQVLVVSSNARAYGGNSKAQHTAAIAAAREAGARRIVYTSHMGVSRTSAFPPMLDHAETEAMLAESGLPFTALRNGFYAGSGIGLLGDAVKTGKASAPADGPVSWTTHADLAEAAAVILLDEGRFEGATPPLTASQSLDLAAIAAAASEVTGRPIERVTVSDEDHRAAMAKRGLPSQVIDIAVGLFVASRNGEFAAVDPTLGRLLGREPATMRAALAERLAA